MTGDCNPRHGHPAVLAANDLMTIVDMWPELDARLASGGGAKDDSGIAGAKTIPLPIRPAVLEVIAELDQWATFLSRILINETGWKPNGTSTPALLRQVSRRVGHFTEHQDEMLRVAFTDDLNRLLRLVQRTARPSGRRTIQIGAKCWEHGTSDLGARIPCGGNLTVIADPERPTVVPDVVCDRDREHRIDPVTWQRAWRRTGDAQRAVKLVAQWHSESLAISPPA